MEQLQHRPEDRQARQAEVAAGLFQAARKVALQQRVEHDPRRILDFVEDALELFLRPHQRVHVLDRRNSGVLRSSSTRHRDQRFAGRIGDEVKMEVTRTAMGHG
jgi:hypothetical protein